MKHVDVSVVIPTRDRPAELARTLRALARQRCSPSSYEVVVSVDGGAADAPAAGADTGRRWAASHLPGLDLPYPLIVVGSEECRGAAAARNLGASSARGDVLLFLDDDIEADPGLIAAHVAAQHEGAHVTIGYLPPCFEDVPRDFFRIVLRRWWEAMFAAMRQPGHRYWFRDLLTGNCAMPASLFARLGGFDPDFRCHEDYEFAVRAIATGAVLRFVEAARGSHHERTTLERTLARKRDEGRADVLMVRKHPELVPSLPLGIFERVATRRQHLLRRLLFERPAAGRFLVLLTMRALTVLEAGRFRGRWEHRVTDLLHYWYWRGIADEVPTLPAVEALLAGCRSRSEWSPAMLEVDLAHGLDLSVAHVDRHRPDGLRVMLGGVRIGEIAPVPGAERLAGQHLRAALARELAGPFLEGLARSGAIPLEVREGVPVATGTIPADTIHF